MSNRNPKHNARANAQKALAARRAKEERAKRLTKTQKETARIEAVVRRAKRREAQAKKQGVDILHYDPRMLRFTRLGAVKIG